MIFVETDLKFSIFYFKKSSMRYLQRE